MCASRPLFRQTVLQNMRAPYNFCLRDGLGSAKWVGCAD
jgi:hypothetical protein